MPNSKQAEKRMRQDERRRLHNRVLKSRMRTAMRRVREACEQGDKSTAAASLAAAMKHIDKCAKSRVVHPNNAARKKSLLARQIAALG
ncbi:MAG: 30S ribosomal protein S20 [Planctomycetota bacterium]